ncbi:uncharacterized protein LOC118337926 [Morone saxatilis]|uniref:uncharacterized protein LOC118337926 n=1 Tax=Morone saxatilis TaxID=34816 RepID=UPI0015E21A5F|nr:uncharacterized protein LOC118337926 [Morone saxatilis]
MRLALFFCPRHRAKHQEDRERALLTCQPSPVVAAVGEDVTLDCHLKLRRDVTRKTVEWILNKTDFVLVYRNRGFSPADQGERFKGRASPDSSVNLSEGKLPVKISSVGKTDAGAYSCSVGTGRERISCSTELIVDTERKHQEDRVGGTKNQIKNKANPSGPTFALVLVWCTLHSVLRERTIRVQGKTGEDTTGKTWMDCYADADNSPDSEHHGKHTSDTNT